MSEVIALTGVVVMSVAVYAAGYITGAAVWRRKALKRAQVAEWALTRLGQERRRSAAAEGSREWWQQQQAKEAQR